MVQLKFQHTGKYSITVVHALLRINFEIITLSLQKMFTCLEPYTFTRFILFLNIKNLTFSYLVNFELFH